MESPEGFVKPGSEHLVCKLKKSIYTGVHPSIMELEAAGDRGPVYHRIRIHWPIPLNK
ncbi:hypothetical protein C8R41DRAFT_821790, partial [Lentinula lateritia]